MCYQWSFIVKGKQHNLSWHVLFSCIVWNLWLHWNDVVFNVATPNLQICFSMMRRSIVLWLRLDSNSMDLDDENVLITYDANSYTKGRRWFHMFFSFLPCFKASTACMLSYLLSSFSFACRTCAPEVIIFLAIFLINLSTITKKQNCYILSLRNF